MRRRGIIFILSAPSGAGKTTLFREALASIPDLTPSISLTTRKPRSGEIDGVDYYFTTEQEFARRRERGELVESAHVFGAEYGTPRAPLEAAIRAAKDILLDIDIEGARQVRRAYPRDTVSIFVAPPSLEELQRRLELRATEDSSSIKARLARAKEELAAVSEYDYLVLNCDRTESLKHLKAIIQAERLAVKRLSGDFGPWKK